MTAEVRSAPFEPTSLLSFPVALCLLSFGCPYLRPATRVRTPHLFSSSGIRRYGCPLLFIVGVDDENRTCVLGQGVLRSESTETFKWFLDSYEEAAGGRRPKVRLPGPADGLGPTAVHGGRGRIIYTCTIADVALTVIAASSGVDSACRMSTIRTSSCLRRHSISPHEACVPSSLVSCWLCFV